MDEISQQQVLVVGGGFAGVKAALELSRDQRFKVTVLSDHSHFRYYPTLYHAATGGKRNGASIRLSHIFEDKPIAFERGRAVSIDRARKVVKTEDNRELPYDAVILGLGNVTNYFGIEGLDKYSYGIKSIEEAEQFKAHLHDQFIENGCPDLNYVIVGGGPTGVELAGSLPSYLKHIMKNHKAIDCKLEIKLIEAAPRLLPRSPESISRAVEKRLKKLGVDVMTNASVKGQTSDALMIGDTPLPSRTVVWTAGVTNHPFFKENNFALNEKGKVQVDAFLQAEPGIFVVGDNANTPFSGQAQTALLDGEFVAHNLIRQANSRAPEAYTPKQPVSVIPVGKGWAAVTWGSWNFTGWLGSMLRAFADLIGFHDLESWPKASSQWMTTRGRDDDNCPVCNNTPRQ